MANLRKLASWAGEHPLLCAAVFFVIAFSLRLLCANWLGPISVHTRPDEPRYLHLAKSIAEGGPLLIQGAPTYSSKILYPLMISPAFLLASDPVAQIKTVVVINCLLMASMMFPLALLVRKLSSKPSVLLLTLAFAAALPDFMYTATIMSEPVYWPLCVWVFYFFHGAMAEKEGRKRLPLFALFGFFTWLVYLTKEVGVAFLIAAAAILFYEGVRGRNFKQNGLALLVSAAAFFAPLFIVKQALFPDTGNSYDNEWNLLDLSALKSPDVFVHMLRCTAALFMAAILTFYVLPVLLPLFRLRKLGEEKRRIYLFTILSLAITAGAIAFVVSIPEGLENRVPRLHMRMLAPFALPFVILCFDFLLSKAGKKKKQNHGQQSILAVTIAFCVLLIALLPVVPVNNVWVDRASLSISHLVWMLISCGMDRSSANLIWHAWLALMLALTIAGAACFILGKKKAILTMLLCTMLAAGAADNLFNYRFIGVGAHTVDMNSEKLQADKYFSYIMGALFPEQPVRDPSDLANTVVAVSDYLRQRDDVPGRSVLVCLEPRTESVFETYASQRLRPYFFIPMSLADYLEAGNREYVFGADRETKGQQVSYIVVREEFNPFTNAELVYSQAPFLVLRNLDPARVLFAEP